VDAGEVLRFLRRVAGALPPSAPLAAVFAAKVEQLRAAAPLLRAATRREVLLFRAAHLRRAVGDLLEAGNGSGSGGGVGRGGLRSPGGRPAAAALTLAGDNGARGAQLSKLQAEFSDTQDELVALTVSLRGQAAEYEASRGEAFLYKGVRLLATLDAELAAVQSHALRQPPLRLGGAGGY
jgi:hypothetical protein